MINGQRQRWRLQNKKGWSRVCRHQVPGSHQCWAPGRAWPAPRPRPGVLTCALERSACLLSDELAGAGLRGPSFGGGGWGGADGHRGSIHTGPEPIRGEQKLNTSRWRKTPDPWDSPKKPHGASGAGRRTFLSAEGARQPNGDGSLQVDPALAGLTGQPLRLPKVQSPVHGLWLPSDWVAFRMSLCPLRLWCPSGRVSRQPSK